MRALKIAGWIGVAAVGRLAFAIVTRLYRPAEHINALWLVVAAACTYLLAYRIYGA